MKTYWIILLIDGSHNETIIGAADTWQKADEMVRKMYCEEGSRIIVIPTKEEV
jgi:hypothetical protein